VNNNTGYYTRTALLGDLFNYVNDVPTVAFDAASYFAGTGFTPVDLSATATSNLGADAVMYRWDFGDGSEYEATAANAVSHQYQVPGNYYARVEVTDEYGHTAVSTPVRVIVGYHIFMPITMRNNLTP
jgi:PKD repeat protein